MLIVGERINSTRKNINEAIKNRNAAFILKEARQQLENGASFLDVNCAVTSGDEIQEIDWVISIIQSQIRDVNICIDSPNYLAVERGLKVYDAKGSIMINSVTGEEEKLVKILPLAKEYHAKLIALTIDANGLPDTSSRRFEIAKAITDRAAGEGLNTEDLYIDPLIRPISTEPGQAKEFLGAIGLIKGLGKVKVICGLSNISFGLPDRRLINSTFLSMAMFAGIDAAILDPMDKYIRSGVAASRAILCDDEYCADYIKLFREGQLI